MADRRWLAAGRIGSPHGLDGSFLVREPRPALLTLGQAVTVAGAARRIERRAGHAGRVILRLAGCGDRAQAAALRGRELLVARADAPALGADEWWPEDLVGCTVRDGTRAVGTVARVLALPSCEVLEVERAPRPALLVPLIGDAVRVVDVAARAIEIDLRFLGEDAAPDPGRASAAGRAPAAGREPAAGSREPGGREPGGRERAD